MLYDSILLLDILVPFVSLIFSLNFTCESKTTIPIHKMSSSNSHGTLPTSIQNGIRSRETDPLLPKSSEASVSQRIREHMTRDVRKHRADLVLLLSYIITGLLDSSAVFIWGSFVSMQTGNTVCKQKFLFLGPEVRPCICQSCCVTFQCLGARNTPNSEYGHVSRSALPQHPPTKPSP